MTISNPSGCEPMAAMGASDKLIPARLGGIENRLASACPVQDTWV